MKKRSFSVVFAFIFFNLGTFCTKNRVIFAENPPVFTMKTVKSTEKIEHLFTHNLISHPEIAFEKRNAYGKNLDEDCLTPNEFKKILQALYDKNYALCSPYETFEEQGKYAKRKDFLFPNNKNPLIISFDDVVYARKNLGKGTSDKLALCGEKVLAYTKNYGYHEKEFVPILENFIEKHPDFSYKNARGIIFLTGFDGILGYRTDRNAPNREKETEQAKEVVEKLKEKGWFFGCHTYSHYHTKKKDAKFVEEDIKKWKNEVEPLVGNCDLFAYPYGEWAIGENCSDERLQVLVKTGFRVFYGVGNNPFYTLMPTKGNGDKILFQDRCAMDGISLRNGNLARFFDFFDVYDVFRPVY